MTPAFLGCNAVCTRPFLPWPDCDHEEEAAFLHVLHSRQWGGYHLVVKQLESEMAELHHRNPLFGKYSGLLVRYEAWHAAQDYEHLILPEAERDLDDLLQPLKSSTARRPHCSPQ